MGCITRLNLGFGNNYIQFYPHLFWVVEISLRDEKWRIMIPIYRHKCALSILTIYCQALPWAWTIWTPLWDNVAFQGCKYTAKWQKIEYLTWARDSVQRCPFPLHLFTGPVVPAGRFSLLSEYPSASFHHPFYNTSNVHTTVQGGLDGSGKAYVDGFCYVTPAGTL